MRLMLYATISALLIIASTPLSAAAIENAARNAPYTLWPAPNYHRCTDPNDKIQLTDGERTSGYFWVQQGTVGWQRPLFVSITVDLEEITPIQGASFRTAAGKAGVEWPVAIHVQVSNDGEHYFDQGNLIDLDDSDEPLSDDYAVRQFTTTKLKTPGRYVRFLIIPGGPYVFVDEIEVFRGPDAFLRAEHTGQPADDANEFVAQYRFLNGVQRRFRQDIHALGQTIRSSSIPETRKNSLLERLEIVRARLEQVDIRPQPDFRTILPLCAQHADLFRIQADLWRTQGHPPLTARTARTWDPLGLFDPTSQLDTPIEIHTMRKEYRSGAFNLSNATDAPMRASIRFDGLPESPTPSYITLHRVSWTDTRSGQVVASALPEVEPYTDGWKIEILPGLTQQIWLTFHVVDQPAGSHVGRVVVTPENGDAVALPVRLTIYPLRFPDQTTLWLGGWSYTDGEGSRGVTPQNRPQLLDHLQSRFVNAPWAVPQIMRSFELVEEDPPRFKLDTKRFDDWLTQWPDARTYMVFLAIGETFVGAQMGTEPFNQRVGAWISAWVSHLKTKSVRPDQLALLLVDEPRRHEQDEIIIAWAKAIKKAEPDVVIWEDPIYHDPRKGQSEMFDVCDVVCPNRPRWLEARALNDDFYLAQRDRGKTLQLYSCSGPAKLLDPYSYYRLQAWHCWQIGANGSYFWAFGDNGNTSSWNQYVAGGSDYAPMFLDDHSVTPAKQMEAIRESVEDYEYFVMLRQATDHARAAGTNVDKAAALLASAARTVLDAPDAGRLRWHTDKDRGLADTTRIQLLNALVDLSAKEGKKQ
jgi:hypothetical protein